MNEYQAIEYVNNLSKLDKLRIYMDYFINMLVENGDKPVFEDFVSEKNIIKHNIGETWKERGFASKEWINLCAGSIYHYVYHDLINYVPRKKVYFKEQFYEKEVKVISNVIEKTSEEAKKVALIICKAFCEKAGSGRILDSDNTVHFRNEKGEWEIKK